MLDRRELIFGPYAHLRWKQILAYGCGLYVALTIIVAGVLELVCIVWHPFPAFAVMLYGLSLAFIVMSFVGELTPTRINASLIGMVFANIGLLMIFIVLFSEFCRHWYMTFGDFHATSTNYWYWLRYGFSWVLDNYSLNFTQVFDWNVSDVHALGIWPRIMVFAFNVMVDFVAIKLIVSYAKRFALAILELIASAAENTERSKTAEVLRNHDQHQ